MYFPLYTGLLLTYTHGLLLHFEILFVYPVTYNIGTPCTLIKTLLITVKNVSNSHLSLIIFGGVETHQICFAYSVSETLGDSGKEIPGKIRNCNLNMRVFRVASNI